jgi:hypothetical protein
MTGLLSPLGAAFDAAVLTASTAWTWTRTTIDRTGRLLDSSEVVFDELLLTLREVRPLLRRLDSAVETGVLDDLARTVVRLDRTITMLEEVAREAEARLPSLDSVAATQADVAGARAATERLVSLVDSTLTQLDSLPGAGLVRRRISRVAAEADSAGDEEDAGDGADRDA